MKLFIKNIKELIQVEKEPVANKAGVDMAQLETIPNAYLLIEGDKISGFGSMAELEVSSVMQQISAFKTIDATGKMVFPCWCDSHTHLVYPASREGEYVDKIRGLSYEEIARRGGGILNSARRLSETSEEELIYSALARLQQVALYGTGAIEIKSGYGLTTEGELKMLRVIRKLKQLSPLTIKSTFLGAHSIPVEYRGNQTVYVDKVIHEMLPKVAEENLADFVDVFCERGFFTVEDTDRILTAAAGYGLRPKIHANELDYSGGVRIGVRHGALSVDHLEFTGEEEIRDLTGSGTMPTILPGSAFFLGLKPAPARKMIDAGLPVAMASDFNPGSSPSGNVQFILSLAGIVYKMLPEEGINAVTINSAYAMDVVHELGSIAVGKRANVFITKSIPSYAYMSYSFGDNKVEAVILNGEVVTGGL
jgi:imidazolonepropionase